MIKAQEEAFWQTIKAFDEIGVCCTQKWEL